jgi:hypothetical protein
MARHWRCFRGKLLTVLPAGPPACCGLQLVGHQAPYATCSSFLSGVGGASCTSAARPVNNSITLLDSGYKWVLEPTTAARRFRIRSLVSAAAGWLAGGLAGGLGWAGWVVCGGVKCRGMSACEHSGLLDMAPACIPPACTWPCRPAATAPSAT